MAKLILSNRSYLIGFNFPEEATKTLNVITKQRNFRFINEMEMDECVATLEKVKHLIGVFIFTEGLEEQTIEQLEALAQKRGFPSQTISSEAPPGLMYHVSETLKQLPAKRLAELVDFAANYSLPFIFPGLPQKLFSETTETLDKYNSLVTCDCLGEEIIGHATFKLDSSRLRGCYPDYADTPQEMIVDRQRELVNQFLGLVNFNLNKLGIEAAIGLPLAIDMSTGVKVHSSLYCPAVAVADQQGICHIEFGFINTEGKPLFSLGEESFTPPTDEVELF